MRRELYEWVPVLEGTILEVGKRSVKDSSDSPYPASYGVDLFPGKGVDLVCDAAKLPFADNSWDHGVCLETLEHVEDWRGVLSELWRVLKDTLVLTTPTKRKGYHAYPSDYWRWEEDDYEKIFRGQQILKLDKTWRKGIGVHVRKKTGKLDLSIEPYKVKN